MTNYKNNESFAVEFLKNQIDKKVTVYLVSGIKLSGVLLNFSEFHILIEGQGEKIEGKPQLVYTHAISTVLPNNL